LELLAPTADPEESQLPPAKKEEELPPVSAETLRRMSRRYQTPHNFIDRVVLYVGWCMAGVIVLLMFWILAVHVLGK